MVTIVSLRKTQNLDPAAYFVNENPRFGKIYAETHRFQVFPENALIDPQLSMTKEVPFHSFVQFTPTDTISRPLSSI